MSDYSTDFNDDDATVLFNAFNKLTHRDTVPSESGIYSWLVSYLEKNNRHFKINKSPFTKPVLLSVSQDLEYYEHHSVGEYDAERMLN